jgi:glycosidase
LLVLASPAFAAGPFSENGGVVVFEAENFDAKIDRSSHAWTLTNLVAGASGTYMQALPDDNCLGCFDPNWLTNSPEMQYTVNFANAATHYVWVRGNSVDANGDSFHAGIDGTTNTAARITNFNPNNAWVWTNRTSTGNAATISVGSTGNHTFSLWVREDGMRVDRVILTTNANFSPTTGNVYHFPINGESALVSNGIPTMRNPFTAIFSNSPVALYTGNQFQGGGNPGNQLQTGSTIFYKKSADTSWSALSMAFYMQSGNNKYYSNSIPAIYNAGDVVQYYFKIPYSDHLPTFVYGDDASWNTAELESVAQASPFSFTVKAKPATVTPSPADWRDLNIYQIITDRFYDGDPSNNDANPYGTFEPGNGNAIHGGDFRGIQRKLDYIRSLGANAIWISPVLLNSYGQYHGYLTIDPYQIDPHWGTFDDMTNMIAAAHARGIYVIVDVICNHPADLLYSTDSQFLTTFRAPPNGYTLQWRDPARQYAAPWDWLSLASLFHTNGLIQDFNNQQQVELGELRNLDDFRTEITYVRTNQANIYQYWISRADWDGFRVDTVKHVEQGFWQFWSPQIHQYATGIGKSNFFMFGETVTGDDAFNGSYTGTKGGGNFELDSMHDYPLYQTVNSVFAQATGNTKQIEDHYNNVAGNYDPGAEFRLNTFLDNHDQTRFLSYAGNNTNRLAVALGFLYTARGLPSLYYGTEQAFNGSKDANNSEREDMFDGGFKPGTAAGDNFNETYPLFRYVAMLNNFRRNYISLRRGGHRNLWNDPDSPGLFAYARTNSTEEVYVVFNTGGSQSISTRPTTYTNGTVLVNLLDTNETITVTGGSIPSISVPGPSIKMFIAQSLWKPLDPVVVGQSPAHGATNVPPTTPLVLTFSKPMDTNSVPIAGTWSGQTQLTVNASWPLGATNIVFIGTNATDAVDGKHFFAPYESYFVTAASAGGDFTSPTVAITSPSNSVALAGVVTVTGNAADDAAVTKVEVRVDAGNWFTATGTTSWNLAFDSRNLLNGSHTIYARATDTAGNVSAIDSRSVRFINTPGQYVARISAGNAYDVTNCDSTVWVKDQPYMLGSSGYIGGAPTILSANAVTGICDAGQMLYRRARESRDATTAFSYQFDCPEGLYETTLLFSETYTNVVNARKFNVFIQGQPVLTNFDLFAVAGQDAPVTRVFTNTLASPLVIQFTPVSYLARVAGIQVRRLGDIDTDSDGIPDWWMRAYFDQPTGQAGADPDGDGFTNLQEYMSGIDPADASSALRITNIERAGNDIVVSWLSAPNKSYELQRTSAPGGPWTGILTNIGMGGIVSLPDPGAATNVAPQYYRVRLIP